MAIYIVPDTGDFTELSATASRVSMQVLSPRTVRDFILETHSAPIAVVALAAKELLILNRHAASLLNEMPSVVQSVPGLIYTGDWMSVAATFPTLDWKELSKKMEKSGLTAFTPDQMEKRDRGAAMAENQSALEILRRMQGGDAVEEPVDSSDVE